MKFTSFLPAISKPALKKISGEVRRWRLHRKVPLTMTEIAKKSTRSFAAGSSTTGRSTAPRCVRSSPASTPANARFADALRRNEADELRRVRWLPRMLVLHGIVASFLGAWDVAVFAGEEARRLVTELGAPLWIAGGETWPG